METRVAVIGIVVEDEGAAETVNDILHEFGRFIIGRMGVPYRERGINVISIAVDAPENTISALTGRLGSTAGVNAKAAYSNKRFEA